MATESDALIATVELLSAGWVQANTSSIRPRFWRNINQPVGGFNYAMGDPVHILVYPVSHTNVPNGLGANYRDATVDRVSIDIRCKYLSPEDTWDLGRKCYNELRRIVSGSVVNNPITGFQQLLRDEPVQDFSTAGFFRYVTDWSLRNFNVER